MTLQKNIFLKHYGKRRCWLPTCIVFFFPQYFQKLSLSWFLKSGLRDKRLKPLLDDKILDWSKLKSFADNNLKVVKMPIYVLDRVENIVGKGVNAGLPAFFFFFPTLFSKALLSMVIRSQHCFGKS